MADYSIGSSILGVVGEDLGSSIECIEPVDLVASISGRPFLDLSSVVSGFEAFDVAANIHGFKGFDLTAIVHGVGSGVSDMRARLLAQGIYGISGSIYGQLYSLDLPAFLEAVPPVNLGGQYSGRSYVDLGSTLTGEMPPDSISGLVSSTGGYYDLSGLVDSSEGGVLSLSGFIQGAGEANLQAYINNGTQSLLGGFIDSGMTNSTGLVNLKGLIIAPSAELDLSGSYSISSTSPLGGYVSAIDGVDLPGRIKPKIFFIESSIPINTYAISDIRAVINSNSCGISSGYADLQVIIKGNSYSDLRAEFIGLTGQYAIEEDELAVYVKNGIISEDWIPFIIDQPVVEAGAVNIILTSAHIHDLGASIEGVQNSSNLLGSITPLYYSNVERDSTSSIEWVNTNTGERKIVRILFFGDASTFYYSSAADTSFSFNPEDHLEIIVESYDKPEEGEENFFLTTKTGVKRCIVNDLNDFNTIDEAIRFGIMCAVSEISSDLRAMISSKGSSEDLGGSISPVDLDNSKDLRGKYFLIENQPTLEGIISATGSYTDLTGFIKTQVTGSTTELEYTETLGVRYKPTLVTHGNGSASVVLTRYISTDRMLITESPDLNARVEGIVSEDLTATISGQV